MQTLSGLLVTAVDLAVTGVVVLGVAYWNRLWFSRSRSSFVCRVAWQIRTRPNEVYVPWSRHTTRAKWHGDVLMIQVGVLWSTTLCLRVDVPMTTCIKGQPSHSFRRLGRNPESLLIERGCLTPLRLVARRRDRMRLIGPFLTVALADHLPTQRPEGRFRAWSRLLRKW